MVKATLNLNDTQFAKYHHLELEHNWRSIPMIQLWLRVRGFNLSNPIMVTRDSEENTLVFFQAASSGPKTVVLVHPNSQVLQDLYQHLRDAGHMVYAFTKVEEANRQIQTMIVNKQVLHKIVVPSNLEVSYNYTYKQFLNRLFPAYQVLTIDKRPYRDPIDLRISKEKYLNQIMGE